MDFVEHGTFEISVKDDLLVINANGAFNEESVKHFYNDLSILLDNTPALSKHSTCVIALYEIDAFGPEVELTVLKGIKKRKSIGYKNTAYVLMKDSSSILKQQIQSLSDEVGVYAKFFDNFEIALSWAKLN